MAQHSSLGASSAERWFACPGSVTLSKDLPEENSEFAHEGTCAHYLAERCLKRGIQPDYYKYEELTLPKHDQSKGLPKTFTVTKDMVFYVSQYVDYCNALGGETHVEQRIDYSRWVGGGFGTADFVSLNADGILEIVDLKYGKGIMVNAYKNKQGLLYALGAWDLMSMFEMIRGIKITIHQPRLDHVSSYEINIRQLMKFAKKAKKAGKAASKKGAPLHAGTKQCQWCKVGKQPEGCAELDRFVKEEALDGFDFLSEEPQDVDDFMSDASHQRLERLVANTSLVQKVLKLGKEQAETALNAGEKVKGLKLVKGRKSQKYTEDDEAILRRLKNNRNISNHDVVVSKVITPAVARKMKGIPDAWKKKFIEYIDGKLVVVPESDSREAVSPKAEALEGFEFENDT